VNTGGYDGDITGGTGDYSAMASYSREAVAMDAVAASSKAPAASFKALAGATIKLADALPALRAEYPGGLR
jgi:hypothetical protein